MPNDGSLASLIETHLRTEIGEIAEIGTDKVDFFAGVSKLDDGTGEVIEECRRNRSPYVLISWEERIPIDKAEGLQDYDDQFAIFIVVENVREDGAARLGDGSFAGVNLLCERIIEKLNETLYDIAETPYLHADAGIVGRQSLIWHPRGRSIVRMEYTIKAVRKSI